MTQQLERKYVNEYLREKYADKHHQTRVWLGALPPGKEAAEFQVIGRWADMIIFEPEVITIIEAKLEPSGKAIGQLQLYGQLFRQTLRFQEYWKRDLDLKMLTTRVDDPVKDLCESQGIAYEVFRPDWITYWEKRRFRL